MLKNNLLTTCSIVLESSIEPPGVLGRAFIRCSHWSRCITYILKYLSWWECIVNSFSSTRLKTWKIERTKKSFVTIQLRVPCGCNLSLTATTRDRELPAFHIYFSVEGTSKVWDGIFGITGLLGKLEGKNNRLPDKQGVFFRSGIHRSKYKMREDGTYDENAHRLQKGICRCERKFWRQARGKADLRSLESRVTEFKKMLADASEENCDSGWYPLGTSYLTSWCTIYKDLRHSLYLTAVLTSILTCTSSKRIKRPRKEEEPQWWKL